MHRINDKFIKILRARDSESLALDSLVKNDSASQSQWLKHYAKQLHRPLSPSMEDTFIPDALELPPTEATDLRQPAQEEEEIEEEAEEKKKKETHPATVFVSPSPPSSLLAVAAVSAASTASDDPQTPSLPPQPLPLPPQLARLADLIRKFCGNGAVNDSGCWTMNIPIDPALLRGATLSMSVSHFELSLRFTLIEPKTKDLICVHKQALYGRLIELVAPRNVEIVVF